ncbi:F-box/kelch-repeat protein At1g51550 isoform X1 [Selaginella moellendorffii]|uniref:F-box/kelch-repeat protein At1g51550 isoform X1 n=1 Tax=Selaginella moellendorffii TaxID=88036 RepID=UPI000D1C6CED|nr:F-box/kelch-repeat protein At1g51550 isoform X1 [Selaginella moellendorffii]XP_024541867.1 F-box/kelch-repeat protein At1g51550 isoform X1 [Selaginella moellendorffii]XP_024541872.1 F-box/kelch-repeat protein At1g51550 isoform X1 [Selaginella moellendorffii]XP_024541880.1 F-box/kelch-repeat protein At1g51550 isoform X1 [Selaginella moellendorffii]|eukprot:XP_024541863.1 F-box/kelch-repeat protein At1g51550 isoform X1 [Selaginella moellendorffii]
MSSNEATEMEIEEEQGEEWIKVLGSDQLLIVLHFLPVSGIVAFGLTCHRFYDLVSSDSLWARICRREWGDAVVDAWPNSRLRKRSWKQLYAEMLFCGAVAWHHLEQPDPLPLGRASHSMINAYGKVFVFGGGCEGGRALGDTWIAPLPSNTLLTGIHWQLPRIQNPPARFGHSCVYLEDVGLLVLFGGISDTGTRYLDTWINDTTTTAAASSWHLLPVSHSPLARGAHACCYAGDKKVVVFGGIRNDGARLHDTWVLDLSQEPPSWREVATQASPCARSGHTLTRIATNRMVLFGGRGAHFEVLNDVWLLSLQDQRPTWTELSRTITDEAPSPRAGHSASIIFGNRILIFGGEDARRTKKRDVWVLDPEAVAAAAPSSSSPTCSEKNYGRKFWKKLRVRGQSPSRTSFHGACSLGTGHAVLVFGGMVDDPSSSGIVFNSGLFLLQLIP